MHDDEAFDETPVIEEKYNSNNNMKLLEKILAVGIVLALMMKFSLTPGGDMLALWTMTLLACVYYPLGFLFFNQIRLRDIFNKAAYKNLTAPKVIFAIVTGIGLSTIVIGSLFKFLNFTGGGEMLFIGLIIAAVVFVISLMLLVKNKDTNSKFILWRVGIIGVIGFFLFFTSELAIVKFQYRNHPRYIEAYTNYLRDPDNEDLAEKLELEHKRIRLTEEDFKRYEKSVNDKAPE